MSLGLRLILAVSLGVESGVASAAESGAESGSAPYARDESLSLRTAPTVPREVPRFGRFEVALDLTGAWTNPFDPAEIDVWAEFLPPEGPSLRVNGYFDRPFSRRLEGGRERVEPAGEPIWRIRFTPGVEGRWRCRVHARDRRSSLDLPEHEFSVTRSAHPGFLRRSARNPRALERTDGTPYFAVGENVCWGGDRGSFSYDAWLPALGEAGGNWIRIWMSSWNCALEWSREPSGEWRSGGYHGVGVYSLDNAWKLDTILDLAERQGVAVMLCLGTYGEFNEGGYFNEGQWKAHPYNAANGGPCATPGEFWTKAEARALYQRRLRYLAARHSWRTNLHSWEFWNEAKAPAPWVAEMARYLAGTGEFEGRGADPHGHLVTTTYGNEEVWKIPEIDITQTHHYGMGDVPDSAPPIRADALDHFRFGKPHLMAEFGIDWRDTDSKYDPEGKGINLHNGLWASAASGNSGGAMIWYWDNYVHPKRLYPHFKPLRSFVDTIPWNAGEWTPVEIPVPAVTEVLPEGRGITLASVGQWGKSAIVEFEIGADRRAGDAALPGFLYGPAKPERTTPTFRFRFDRPGRFAFKVDRVSDRATIRFILDGGSAGEVSLSARPPADPSAKPEYVSTRLEPEWGIYQARFDKECGIEVPVGAHALEIAVAEGDWVGVSQYTLTGFSSVTRPLPLNLHAIRGPRLLVLWAQNAEHHWKNVFEKKEIRPAPSCDIQLSGLPDGDARVEWWDTWKGEVSARSSVQVIGGTCTLRLPEIATDVAVRIEARDR